MDDRISCLPVEFIVSELLYDANCQKLLMLSLILNKLIRLYETFYVQSDTT